MAGIMQLAVFLLGFSTTLIPQLHKTFSYGKGPGTFAITGVDKGEPIGPYGFAVGGPNNDIYIPDPINKEIKIVSSTGSIVKTIPFAGYFDDIRVDQSGNIYILDRMGQRILVLDQSGKARTEYELQYDIVKYPCKLTLKNGNVLIKHVNQTLTDAVTKASFDEKYEVAIKDDRLDIFLHENGNIRQIASERIEGIVSAEVLGTDKTGNIYVQIETKRPEIGVDLKVLKFDAKGTLIGNYKIPHNDYFVWTSRLLDIDNAGNIYQVLPAKDRLEINIWKTE